MFDRIKEILSEELGIAKEEITPDANLRKNLGISSVEFVDVAMTIEEEFNITLDEDKLRAAKTVGDLVKYLEGLTNK